MSRIIVIGGDGFLGAPIVRALAKRGHIVTAFDRYSRGVPRDTKNVRHLRGDFLNTGDVAEALREQEEVYHFLSLTTPATADIDPLLDIQTNVAKTVELLQRCVSEGVRRMIFASSGGAIYGDVGESANAEDAATAPISPYGIGKLAIERYLSFFQAKHSLGSVILRISNPYGPGQPSGRKQGLIPNAIRNIDSGLPVTLIGDGSSVRDYIYIDDVVSMVLAITHGSATHPLYNIGSGVGHSVRDVLDSIGRVTNRRVETNPVPMPASFVDYAVLDITRFRDEYGFAPEIPLDDGIRRTWEHMSREATPRR